MDLKAMVAVVVAHEEALQLQVFHILQQCEEISRRMRMLKMIIQRNTMRIAAIYAGNCNVRRPRRLWVKRLGNFWEHEVPKKSEQFFKNSFRTDRECFSILVEKLKHLRKQDTYFCQSIPLEKRIAIALYTLGSSSEYRTVGRLFGVSKSIVCKILHEFCEETYRVLAAEYLPPVFLSQEKIEDCVKGFEATGFPQCFGAIDGCHIEIMPPAEKAVDYHNYKGWNSVVLFALVDYRCRFMYINVGSPGSCHDAQIFNHSSLKKFLVTSPLLKDNARQIGEVMVPVVVLGDSAFPFSNAVMKPYPLSTTATPEQKTFNYILSKNRRVVEKAFCHLKARFRRLGKGLDNHPSENNAIIKCCCILHNFFNTHNSKISEKWLTDLIPTEKPQPEYKYTTDDMNASAEEIRKAIAFSLCSPELESVEITGSE